MTRSPFFGVLIRTSFLWCEYRRVLTCVSSKTRSHDVVGASGEAKMESLEVGGHLLALTLYSFYSPSFS